MLPTLPASTKASAEGPKVRRQAQRRVQPEASAPGTRQLRRSGGSLASKHPPAKTSKEAETARPQTLQGDGPKPPAFGPVAPDPLDARSWGGTRGAASLCPSGANSAPNAQTPQWLPFSSGPRSRASVTSTSPELTFQSRAASCPSVSPEFRPHSASSGSSRKQLQCGTGSLTPPPQPPRAYPLAFFSAPRVFLRSRC